MDEIPKGKLVDKAEWFRKGQITSVRNTGGKTTKQGDDPGGRETSGVVHTSSRDRSEAFLLCASVIVLPVSLPADLLELQSQPFGIS